VSKNLKESGQKNVKLKDFRDKQFKMGLKDNKEKKETRYLFQF
jgi:hypothetical protein